MNSRKYNLVMNLVMFLWPGIVCTVFSFLFLSDPFQLLFFKLIGLVYTIALPAVVHLTIQDYKLAKLRDAD
jgi:hypothetical protein